MRDTAHVLWSITIMNPELAPEDKENPWMDRPFKDVSTTMYLVRNGLASHAVIGKEISPKTKQPHFQMALCTSDVRKFSYMKGLYPRAHIESVDYPYEVLVNYCKKTVNFDSYGEIKAAIRVETKYREQIIKESYQRLDKQLIKYYNIHGYPAGWKERGT